MNSLENSWHRTDSGRRRACNWRWLDHAQTDRRAMAAQTAARARGAKNEKFFQISHLQVRLRVR